MTLSRATSKPDDSLTCASEASYATAAAKADYRMQRVNKSTSRTGVIFGGQGVRWRMYARRTLGCRLPLTASVLVAVVAAIILVPWAVDAQVGCASPPTNPLFLQRWNYLDGAFGPLGCPTGPDTDVPGTAGR